ncbi:siderophore-interacting protein [Mycolicibacterium sphagni]|uniref:NADPH-dependent ferric siderophore reductase n=1 Tax=Mycolicibacterium sphagni TaxID=1786 RepID=A0A255DRB7_9MYCO|nr:siderophore-interacting protein [Mycolicibacterium sphagni]OYN81221.1 NADPH-dependent ferric siderophore reductase [Mycolicibacterium sphagni]
MADNKPSRGWQGTVLKLFRAGEYELTVTGREQLSEHYLRLHFDAGGMLVDRQVHPTMWIRMWFPGGAKLHQRGYTLVNPDSVSDTVDIEFALHDGIASRWACAARPGDAIGATVLGSSFTLPKPEPVGYVIVGDTASLPAINSLLDSIGDAPATVFLAAGHDDDRDLPVARSAGVTWIDRRDSGAALVEAVSDAAYDAEDHFGWVACDNRTTRAVAKILREDYRIPRTSIKAQAYWAEGA